MKEAELAVCLSVPGGVHSDITVTSLMSQRANSRGDKHQRHTE